MNLDLEKLKNQKPKYGPMYDVIFKCLFGNRGNEKITKSFLEDITGKQIEEITTDCKLELQKNSVDDKKMEVDVIAKDNQLRKYIIEMQRKAYDYLPDRFIGYLARTYIADIKVKEDYKTISRTVMVIVMEEKFPNIKEIEKYHTIWNIREQDYPEKILSEKFEIHILELEKYKKQKKKTGKIDMWLEFFINPYGEEVLNMARTYEELRAAVEQLNMLEADEEVRRLADAEAWARYDKFHQDAELKAKARAEGLSEGRAEGRKKGLAEGREEGRAEGRAEAKDEIVKKLKAKGMPLNEIAEITDLTKEEIENL